MIYMTKFSILTLSNSVRELRNNMTRVSKNNFQKLLRAIKFTKDTKEIRLILKPTSKTKLTWFLECFSDSDWVGDKYNYHSEHIAQKLASCQSWKWFAHLLHQYYFYSLKPNFYTPTFFLSKFIKSFEFFKFCQTKNAGIQSR